MSKRNNFSKFLRIVALMVVVGLVMFIIPVSNVFAAGTDWKCPTKDLDSGWTQDSGNGAEFFVKYDAKPTGTLTFPGDFVDNNCDTALCTNLEITEVTIKTGAHPDNPAYPNDPTGPITLVYYPDGTIKYFVGHGKDNLTEIPPSHWPPGVSGWYTVTFNSPTAPSSVDVVQNSTALHDISHVEFYYKCGDVPTTGTIELTKSGLIGADTVDFTLSSTNPVYSQLYTVSVATPTALWTNLAHGTYTLTETPDPNNTYKYTLTVTPAGPYDIGEGEGKSLLYELTADNEAKGKIILEKKGLLDGDSVDFTLTGPNSYSQTRTVTEGGTTTVEWKDLKHGQYTLTETPDPNNTYIYALVVNPPGPYNIGEGEGKSLLFEPTATNSKVEGSIKICKAVDETDEDIELPKDFHFKITGTNISDIFRTITVVDIKGKLYCSDPIKLPFGTYNVWETDTGYAVTIFGGDDPPGKVSGTSPLSVPVTLNEDRKNVTVEFINDPGPGKIQLTKKGLGSGVTAYFKLTDGTDYYDTNGNKIPDYGGEPVTSASNVVTWSGLPWGDYWFKEIIPAGYIFGGYSPAVSSTTPLTIDETNQGATVAVFAVNTKTKDGNGKKDGDGDGIEVLGIQELPFTGFNWIYYVIGMALIIAGGFTGISVIRLLKRKEQ